MQSYWENLPGNRGIGYVFCAAIALAKPGALYFCTHGWLERENAMPERA